MGSTKRQFINGELLVAAIDNRHMDVAEVSEKIGRSKSTLHKWIKKGEMAAISVPLLQTVVGIAPEEYISESPIPYTPIKISDYETINGARLKRLCVNTGETIEQIAKNIGVGGTTPYHFFSKNYIQKKCIKPLEDIYGISFDEYASETKSVDDTCCITLTKDELYKICYAAASAAVREALE